MKKRQISEKIRVVPLAPNWFNPLLRFQMILCDETEIGKTTGEFAVGVVEGSESMDVALNPLATGMCFGAAIAALVGVLFIRDHHSKET